MDPRSRPSAMRAELDRALAAEIGRLDVLVARVSQVLYAGAIVTGLGVAASTSRALGLSLAASSAGYLAWYSLVTRALHGSASSGRSGRALGIATALVDSTVPWVFALGLAWNEGAAYALSSWVPPFLFCALLLGGLVRLRPLVPLLAGVSGAALFALLYFGVLRARLSPEDAGLIVYQPALQVSRAAILLLSGGLAAMATAGMRRVVGRADSRVREQDLFGKYRLVRLIAEGGMGEVFEAEYCPEGGFTRRVAVKRIHPTRANQQRFVDAFRVEAELCARLAHPNLVQVMDFGRVGDAYFLAMEYVDGLTLSAFIVSATAAGQRLGPDVVGFIGRELLAGLEYAHTSARGADGRPLRIVHRDMCPQNVLVSRNGEVKVVDFGMARALREAAAARTRTVRGHLAYLAPEQIEQQPVDPRADLYAVGVMLWELLVGRQLFPPVGSDTSVLSAILSHVPGRVTDYRPDIDDGWNEFLAKAFARDPAARFPSARAMSDALGELAGARSDTAIDRLAQLADLFRASHDATHEPVEDEVPGAGDLREAQDRPPADV